MRQLGTRHRPLRLAVLGTVAVLLGCAAPSRESGDAGRSDAQADAPPDRFGIVPDDFDVPYAGTAEDGRRFFLSDRLFDTGSGAEYVGLFLWDADGSAGEVRVDEVAPGRAGRAERAQVVRGHLDDLGDYVLEPIEVAPFTEEVGDVTFGWRLGRYDDGSYYVGIEPGDFIVYYAPWDGLEYDT